MIIAKSIPDTTPGISPDAVRVIRNRNHALAMFVMTVKLNETDVHQSRLFETMGIRQTPMMQPEVNIGMIASRKCLAF